MADQHVPIDLVIARALREGSLSRRMLLRRGGAGAAALSMTAFLAACGIKPAASPTTGAASATPGATGTPGANPTAGGSAKPGASGTASAAPSASEEPTESAAPTPQASPAGELVWANWPLYIDTDEDDQSKHQTLIDFAAETGIQVRYSENITDNEEFFGTIQPDLAAGRTPQYDLIVMTDWMIAKMAKLGYLQELNVASDVPNFATNAAPEYYRTLVRPGEQVQRRLDGRHRRHRLQHQGHRPRDHQLRGPARPRLQGQGRHVQRDARHDEPRAAQPGHRARDGDPRAREAGPGEARSRRPSAGQFRNFFGNEYTDELVNGNIVIGMAWSGDVYQLALYDDPDLRFVIPKEGGVRFSDNLTIPKNAAHPVDAKLLMDFTYRPEVAATVAEYIGYFTPVAGVSDIVLEHCRDGRDGRRQGVG